MIEKIIQDMANVIWRQFPKDEDGDRDQFEFKCLMETEFPDLKFTFSSQTDEWLFLTDIMLL